jgi:toxin ParE1/3/4
MRIFWSPLAQQDLRDIYDYVAAADSVAAARLITRLIEATSQLAAYPESGRVGRVTGTRELPVVGTDHVICYRVKREDLQITVLHGARKWPNEFK